MMAPTDLGRAARLLLVVAVGASAGGATAEERGDRVIGDFESAGFGDWSAAGSAFGGGPATGPVDGQQSVSGIDGRAFANSFHGGDDATGELVSPEFTVDRDYVALKLGGGNHHGLAGAELLVGDRVVRSTTGSDTEELLWRNWDVRDLAGKRARVRLFDRVKGGWGHVLADRVVLTDRPESSYDAERLTRYRESAGYYAERHRPRFHFTPELNWMNDPNGLVFHDGEYHLFYQHNPFGNAWGHMSWGHAVSRDLVHWEHLPIALWEEHGVMIFSGCAVVDHTNTSGFGRDGAAPLVAVYTSHERGKQAQCLAYSNDAGRTWTKHAGNPVLDLKEQDFRDPKVFWHEPTRRWVMVVALAVEKRLQFYGSENLRDWRLLSEFGPAGAPGKPNWECPDLFELPVEDADGQPTGETRWVLEVDMGAGSVAGGSGGEYFVGRFDGERFTCDDADQRSRWVDWGRDFYAPVSWSDIPSEDGRRIWIGWMNNWQTHLLPTDPWRSAMSVPRSLSLRKTEGGPVLVQRPVRELESLRGRRFAKESLTVGGRIDLTDQHGLRGQQLDILVDLETGDADVVGLRVLSDGEHATEIGYDASSGEVFVDRRASGEVDFHSAFAGRHAAPLALRGDRVRLRVLVDASSVEVFADGGAVVLTDRVFPPDGADRVEVFTEGGAARVARLEVWPLRSVWKRD